MTFLVLTTRAKADLERLKLRLAEKSPRAARRAVERIVEGLDLLLVFPEVGVVTRGNIRQQFIRFGRSAYVVRYQIVGEEIRILRIWHGKEDRPR